jgi:acyl-CoA thioester hydrolase
VALDLVVPFHDCDPLSVVWHGHYFKYLELARTKLLQSVTLDVPDVRGLGFRMYVTDARCRYVWPLRYGQTARVAAWFTDLMPLMRVAYEITNVSEGRRAARAYTTLVVTDARGHVVTEPPEEIKARLPLGP